MSENLSSPRISRRSLLRGGAAAAVVAALPLPFNTTGPDDTSATSPAATTPPSTGRPSRAGIANIHVSHDHYEVHVEPLSRGQSPPPALAPRRLPGVAHGEPPVHRDLPLLRRGRDLGERRPATAARGPGPSQ